MSSSAARATELTPAERIRSVLARAGSLTLVTEGHRCDLVGLHTVDDKGRLTLRLPTDSSPPSQALYAPSDTPTTFLEFTDVAPTAVRDRVRARVFLSGWLTPTGPVGAAGNSHRVDLARATLETASGIAAVSLDELALAAVDPSAVAEAALLTHLADAHQDVVERLTRLADPRMLHGVVRVQPFSLDRYAITLRCEYAHGHSDLRLPFPTPLREAAELGDRIQGLLSAARICRHRRHASSRP
ncbi:DUF2470 domain-containing protein [Streptomyces sp. SYSU K217416]